MLSHYITSQKNLVTAGEETRKTGSMRPWLLLPGRSEVPFQHMLIGGHEAREHSFVGRAGLRAQAGGPDAAGRDIVGDQAVEGQAGRHGIPLAGDDLLRHLSEARGIIDRRTGTGLKPFLRGGEAVDIAMEVSMRERPSVMTPSSGMRSPARTITRSPARASSEGIALTL